MPQPQQRVNASSAYLFWCLSLFGICGIQRFYTGNIGSGIIYLLTWGFFGIGQFIDLFLIPEMVDRRNYHLATRRNTATDRFRSHQAPANDQNADD
jgi:TM2 domain-containing membrane protein YozV